MESNYSGEITVTSNLFLKLADDGFLKFTGLDMTASAAAVFTDDDILTIKNAFKPSDGDYSVILHIRRKDGVFCACLATFHVLFESEEMFLRIRITDLNELRSAKNELVELKSIADAYFDILGGIMLRYMRKQGFLEIFYINDSHRRVLYSGTLEEWKNSLLPDKIVPESEKEFIALCDDIGSARKDFRHSIRARGFSGAKESEECIFTCRFVDGQDGGDIVGCVETGKYKPREIGIDPLNDKDAFLDMLNKRALVEQANRIMSTPEIKNSFFILLDLDNFKSVNDTYGHIVGDEVLTTFTRIINNSLNSRGFVGRMGGDEIIIITENIADQTELRNMLRTIRTTVEWTFRNDPRALNVTCSMGVCEYPTNGSDFNKLYSLADKMLYIAKSKGKNRYIIYTPELHDSQLNKSAAAVLKSVQTPASDKIGIMYRLVDKYLVHHTYNNAKIFSELGEAFSLSEILMIYEDFSVAFQWTPDGISSDIETIVHFKPDSKFGELFNSDNLLVLDGLYKLDGNCSEIEGCLNEKGVKSALIYRIDRGNEFSGYVMFAKKTQRQKWSDYDIIALSTAAKVFDVSMHE